MIEIGLPAQREGQHIAQLAFDPRRHRGDDLVLAEVADRGAEAFNVGMHRGAVRGADHVDVVQVRPHRVDH
ncbi:hypothetical protein D3C86_1701900 [compost metagenome]